MAKILKLIYLNYVFAKKQLKCYFRKDRQQELVV